MWQLYKGAIGEQLLNVNYFTGNFSAASYKHQVNRMNAFFSSLNPNFSPIDTGKLKYALYNCLFYFIL